MAVFVLGAGATRGCSFVDPTRFPCIPPLDGDFFTQLQRVGNDKHTALIGQVMRDVVQLFGPNFDATMETVFTTLEHTIRMLETTGDNRAFKKKDLKEKRDRLEQAIAVVLEESLTEKRRGRSSHSPQQCKYHQRLVQDVLKPGDVVVSFNYDCVIDFALKRYGDDKWNAHYGYGFNLGSRGSALEGDGFWQPKKQAAEETTVRVYKLHGSLHFDVDDGFDPPGIKLKQRPYTRQAGDMKFTIIPPEWHKAYDEGVFATLWQKAAGAINRAEHIVAIGYSLPATDLHANALFRTSIRAKRLKSLVAVNPDREARKRTRTVLQRGLTPDTRVLSFDRLADFVAAEPAVWRI
jgi:hypothetical protein